MKLVIYNDILMIIAKYISIYGWRGIVEITEQTETVTPTNGGRYRMLYRSAQKLGIRVLRCAEVYCFGMYRVCDELAALWSEIK